MWETVAGCSHHCALQSVFYYLCVILFYYLNLIPIFSLTRSLEMSSTYVEVVKVDLEGQGFSCFEAAIGGHGVQVRQELNPDGGDEWSEFGIPPYLVALLIRFSLPLLQMWCLLVKIQDWRKIYPSWNINRQFKCQDQDYGSYWWRHIVSIWYDERWYSSICLWLQTLHMLSLCARGVQTWLWRCRVLSRQDAYWKHRPMLNVYSSTDWLTDISLSMLRYIVQTERKFNNVFALLASWRCEMKKMKVRLAMEYR